MRILKITRSAGRWRWALGFRPVRSDRRVQIHDGSSELIELRAQQVMAIREHGR